MSVPLDTILPVDKIDLRLVQDPHPFALANRVAVEKHWQQEQAENPHLFDGEIALFADVTCENKTLSARCHITRFSTFLYWRTLRPVPDAMHIFAHAILVSSDGALVAVKMSERTANPGQVYFAAGSFEPIDIFDGLVDPVRNMQREVMEETGIDLAPLANEPRFHILSKTSGMVLFRRYYLERTADEIACAIAKHVAAEKEPEIDGAYIIRSFDDMPAKTPLHMPDLVRWHFATPADSSSLVT
jgi:8-oxo-dGTP pyrophosphatase MutT (NUDIX family)